MAFHDVNPQKKLHVLVIPKGEYVDLDDFNNKASDNEIVEFNIGHFIIGESIFYGLPFVIKKFKRIIKN